MKEEYLKKRMHIPDGYLSPGSCALFYAGMAPVWYAASRKVEKTLQLKKLPLLSLGSAFAFVVMMFNFPIPGGSSGHIVGAALVSIVLGPWSGVIAVSIALALQALLFGDGGITTLGANSFNMAFVMSFCGYYIYRALTLGSPGPGRRALAAGLAGYAAVNAGAFFVALILGVQPAIASTPEGMPLYFPYPLGVTLPAVMVPHLVFFGLVEAVATALCVSYLHKTNEGLLYAPSQLKVKPLVIAIAVLVILTPIGLLAGGAPWGEWSGAEFTGLIGYIPRGMDVLSDMWKGLLPDYSIPGVEGRFTTGLLYVTSAAVGSAGAVAAIYLLGRLWKR